MSNLPAKSVYVSKLVQQGLIAGGVGLVAGAALGAVGYLMAMANGLGTHQFLPYFGGTIGLGLGVKFAAKRASMYHFSFVAGVRRALEMSAQGLSSEADQLERLQDAKSNSDVVLDAALKNAGFERGLKGMMFYADRATGTLMLPGTLVDINGNVYGMHAQTTNARAGSVGARAAESAAQRQAVAMASAMAATASTSSSSGGRVFDTTSDIDDVGPMVNTDGTPMLDGGAVDMNGNSYGNTF